MKDPHYYIYSDGSCTGVAIGAWAAAVAGASGEYRKLLYGMAGETTINRCELLPIIEGLVHIRRRLKGKNLPVYGTVVNVISDSEYVVRTLGDLNLDRIKSNRDLWYAYLSAAEDFQVQPRWVSRNSHPFMRTADSVCYGLRKHLLEFDEKSQKWFDSLEKTDPKMEVVQ